MIRLPHSQHRSPVPFTSKSIQERQCVLFLMTWHRNQERLNTDLTSVLYHLRGPDAHQVGNAAFLILYAVCNEDKCLQTAR